MLRLMEDHPIFPGKDQTLWEFSVRWLEGKHFITVFDPGPRSVCQGFPIFSDSSGSTI